MASEAICIKGLAPRGESGLFGASRNPVACRQQNRPKILCDLSAFNLGGEIKNGRGWSPHGTLQGCSHLTHTYKSPAIRLRDCARENWADHRSSIWRHVHGALHLCTILSCHPTLPYLSPGTASVSRTSPGLENLLQGPCPGYRHRSRYSPRHVVTRLHHGPLLLKSSRSLIAVFLLREAMRDASAATSESEMKVFIIRRPRPAHVWANRNSSAVAFWQLS
jgi:hypothetical protein